jgi:hypothetical protein
VEVGNGPSDLESCPVVGCGISSVEVTGSAAREFVKFRHLP